jgi:hypothetical protein
MVNIIERSRLTQDSQETANIAYGVYLRSEISEVHIQIPQSCTNNKNVPEAVERTGFWRMGMKERPK